ncbi:hypothetical protein [Streptomonospora arabica]|uniref:Uncharacterized protein n=1 Tax=Streptomonospora arabica TaxID=412417 RepID=A0ABV9SKL5_9ACTN
MSGIGRLRSCGGPAGRGRGGILAAAARRADRDGFVRKHDGYPGVDAEGEVTGGVAHVDPAFSPYAPPAADGFDAVDAVDAVGQFDAVGARMLARAEDRTDARERWPIGTPTRTCCRPRCG